MHSTGTKATALAIIRSSKKRDAEIGLGFDEMQPNAPLAVPLQDLKRICVKQRIFFISFTRSFWLVAAKRKLAATKSPFIYLFFFCAEY